jgi:hypothetical protein
MRTAAPNNTPTRPPRRVAPIVSRWSSSFVKKQELAHFEHGQAAPVFYLGVPRVYSASRASARTALPKAASSEVRLSASMSKMYW